MAQTTAPPGSPPLRGQRSVLGLVGAGAVLAALIAAVLTLVVNGPVDVVPGLSNPDRLTTVGLPAVRAVAEIAMAIAVGALLLAAFLVPPQRSGYLDVACRTVLGWGWTVVTFGLCLLGPLPVALTGHSATGGAHDVASDSLVLHVMAACLWVGGLG